MDHSVVHAEFDPGYEATVVHGEEECGAGQLFLRPHSPQRDRAGQRVIQVRHLPCLSGRVALDHALDEVRLSHASNRVGPMCGLAPRGVRPRWSSTAP